MSHTLLSAGAGRLSLWLGGATLGSAIRPMPCPERGGVSLEMHEQRRALGPSGIPRFNGQGSSEVLR